MVSRSDYIAGKIYFQVPHQAKAAMILARCKGVPFHFILIFANIKEESLGLAQPKD